MARRYETVEAGDVRRLNRLLAAGWESVRETPVGDGRLVVLLERDGGPPRSGAKLAGMPWDVLEACPLFDGFDRDELTAFVEVCELTTCPTGSNLFEAGDGTAALYVLLEGRVDVVFPELRGESMAVEGFAPPSFFGESTFFHPADHHATATCTEESRVLVLERDTFDELMQESPDSARKLGLNAAGTLAQRLQSADAWVWELLDEIDSVHIARSWRRFRDRILRR